MSDIAIRVENLSKRYRIGLKEEMHDTLAGALTDTLTRPIRNLRRLRRLTTFEDGHEMEGGRGKGEDGRRKTQDARRNTQYAVRNTQSNDPEDIIWALKDVSFEVQRGEVVGIIGRNGAGKSTLLKILSRITEPTSGRVEIHGRVSSLLEVGTGFHPELTGRENIYLNGAILGMTKAEIDRKFDEIVDFSGVEKFIDTPVKRYSSGMRVRLAFSVAAHLEPEVLLIDEVLAVGDVGFQKKCLGKMEGVAGEGRTVLFVSHNMQMIDTLCPRTVLLEEGHIVANGPTGEVLSEYYETLRASKVDAHTALSNRQNRRGVGQARFINIVARDQEGNERYRFRRGETVRFELTFEVLEPIDGLYASVLLRSGNTREPVGSTGKHCITSGRLESGYKDTVIIEIPELTFRPGTYPLYFWLGNPNKAASRYEERRPYDVVDDLTSPLIIYTESEERTAGFVDVESSLKRLSVGPGKKHA